jgi:hypothetical protein
MPGQCGAAMTMMTANDNGGNGKRRWAVEVTRKVALGSWGYPQGVGTRRIAPRPGTARGVVGSALMRPSNEVGATCARRHTDQHRAPWGRLVAHRAERWGRSNVQGHDSLVVCLAISSFLRVSLFSTLCTSSQGFQMSITYTYLIFMFCSESRSERLELCSLIFIFHIQHLIKATSDLLDHIVLLVMSIITTKV